MTFSSLLKPNVRCLFYFQPEGCFAYLMTIVYYSFGKKSLYILALKYEKIA